MCEKFTSKFSGGTKPRNSVYSIYMTKNNLNTLTSSIKKINK